MQRSVYCGIILFFALLHCGGVSGMAAEAPLRSGIYIMQLAGSDMTAAATSGAVHSPMILWPYRPTATWEFRHVGGGLYTIRTNATLMEAGGNRHAPLRISRPNDSRAQKWKLKRVGRYYQIINADTGLAMSLGNGRRVKGSRFHGKRPNSTSKEQLFCIQRPRDPRFCGGDRFKTPDFLPEPDGDKTFVNSSQRR